MSDYRIWLPLLAAFLVYSLLSFLFGPSGVAALEDGRLYRSRLEENLGDLQARHRDLSRRFRILETDPEQILLEARSYGWIREGEKLIVVRGRDEAPRSELTAGDILLFEERPAPDTALFRTAALAAAALSLILSVLWRRFGEQRS